MRDKGNHQRRIILYTWRHTGESMDKSTTEIDWLDLVPEIDLTCEKQYNYFN